MHIKGVILRHPVVTYFALTYLISWGGAFLVVAPQLLHGQPIPQIDGLLMFPVLLLGPSVAGITLTALLEGTRGLRQLFARMGRWRVGGWYAALLLPPALILVVLFAFRTWLSPVFTPHLMLLGVLYGLVPGFLEEIGWTGYAFPRMQAQRGTLAASLVLGPLWGLWHLPVIDFLGAAWPHGAYWLPYVLSFVVAMMAMRVLLVWVYSNTQSVLVTQLLHVSSTASLVILGPAPISPAQEALWYGCYALVLWVVVGLVVGLFGTRLVRQPEQTPTLKAASR